MHRSLWWVWALSVGVALFAAGWRWQVEANYRTVALVVDGGEVRTLQALTGQTLSELLKTLHQSGATTISIPAEQLRDWVLSGVVRSEGDALIANERKRLERLRSVLQRQLRFSLPEPQKTQDGKWRLQLPTPYLTVATVFVGLDRELAEQAHRAGLSVIARLPNPPGLTEQGLVFWLDECKAVNAFAVVFDGEEVLGYRTMLAEVAKAFRTAPFQIGILELVTQKGDRALAAMVPEKVVRVHSISARELVNFTQPELIDRFVRAVRERNIRLCYVRFPFHIKGEPLAVACDYLSTLRQALERQGFRLGVPEPLPPLTMPLWLWGLVLLGAVVLGIAFLCLFFPLSLRQQWGLTVFAFVVGWGLWFLSPLWAARLVALGIAIVAPVLALWLGVQQTLHSGPRFVRTVKGLTVSLGFVLANGLLLAAALFDHRFWLKVSEFAGVKVSQLLPFLLVALLVVSQWMDSVELPFAERVQIARNNWQRLWATPVQWGHAVALLMLLGAIAYWLMRTGNEPGLGVPAWELKLRAAMEDLLIVRPRFKEFLLGHPFLVLAFVFLTGTHLEARIGQWLLLPAVIGLASMMNTFSHAHTPLAFSLLRTVHGVWLGLLIGALLVGAIKWFSAARDKAALKRLAEAKSAPSPSGSSAG